MKSHTLHSNSSIDLPGTAAPQRWRGISLVLIAFVWGVLYLAGLRSPGLLDDVDSVYTEIAREMLQRHDFVTPTIDGIRFFDKPPLMYWMAAGSMHVFGPYDWAARLPLALGVLVLLLAVYALGVRWFAESSPAEQPDRGGLYAALATGLCLGTYLYTRFYIPDILLALWMTLAVHLLLMALERIEEGRSALWPSLAFAAVAALNVLTKGLIGLVFPLGFALFYLLWTRRLSALRDLHLVAGLVVFLGIAAPWHILAGRRNPPVPMPPGLGLPHSAGWAWFYLYNEHIARFLGRRIPHDYGQVPIPLFWLLLLIWLIPWTAFIPAAVWNGVRLLRQQTRSMRRFDSDATVTAPLLGYRAERRRVEAVRATLLWAGLVLGFFTLSSRQEYYHLPALPALALLAGGLLASADKGARNPESTGEENGLPDSGQAFHQSLTASLLGLVPLATVLCLVCGWFALTAPHPEPGASLSSLLSSNPDLYNLSLGHVFDLTGRAMGLFRGPLTAVALGMLALGPVSHLMRRSRKGFAANLTVAAGILVVLLAAHEGLSRFYPILGSKELAMAIEAQRQPGDIVAIDGELTSGSTLLFYGHPPVLLVNGRVNGPWFGSFWPDAPQGLFPDDDGLARLWAGPHRVFLLTYHPDQRIAALSRVAPVHELAEAGGKTVLTNR